MYDLVVKGGQVIDPAQGIHGQRDIGINRGRIEALATNIEWSEAKRVIDARGKIVTPGLIDMHVHVAQGIIPIGLPPDEVGVLSGVTTLCDAGSTGYTNFPNFRKSVIAKSQTDLFCFLHLCPGGLAVMPEIWSWSERDTEASLAIIRDNRDIIKGIKIRAVAFVIQNLGVEAIRRAKLLSTKAKVPLMIHTGIDLEDRVAEDKAVAFTREMLSLLDKGDILTHAFTWKSGGSIKADGTVLSEFKEALQRGVLLDVAQAESHWSLPVARKALEMGILPTTISTDLSTPSIADVSSLLATMSRFLAIGFNLDQLIQMTTINPSRILGEEQRRGSMGINMPADISVLNPTEGEFLFSDGVQGHTFKGNLLLEHELTLKAGVEIKPKRR